MSQPTKRLLSLLFITFVFIYLMTPLGATFNGVIVPDTHPITFGLMGISLGLWLWLRIRGKWAWHRTAFDLIFVLWIVAFAISVLANLETVRRSMIGLWYMLTYIGVWYVLHDLLANRAITRKLLIDAFLYAGSLIVLFSFVQLANQPSFKVPVSLIGNPNALGAVLLAMTPFAVARMLTSSHTMARTGWGLYSIVIIANLLLTLSRGAWLGMFTAIGLLLSLLLMHYDMLSLASLKTWWGNRSVNQRRLVTGLLLVCFAVSIVAGLLFINSFSIQARRPELRTRLWNAALVQFAEKPLTGQGFYTFGRDYGLTISIPPAQSHSHAHSVPLNIMAEMGLIGLTAFLITMGWVMRWIWRRWNEVEKVERLTWIPAIATLAGFGVQHLFDMPAMMPIVALVGLLVMVIVCAPFQPQALVSTWRRMGHPIGLTLLWVGLLISGMWSSGIYQQYLSAMRYSFDRNDTRTEAEVIHDYRETAVRLESVIVRDPLMPIYHQQQALIWGLAAQDGDTEVLQNAILAYQQFLELEPNHAISWANLSAIQWQAGDTDSAIASIEKAIELAPRYTLFSQNLQIYRGDLERETLDLPAYIYNQDFAQYEFLRLPVSITFLPQVGWGTDHNN